MFGRSVAPTERPVAPEGEAAPTFDEPQQPEEQVAATAESADEASATPAEGVEEDTEAFLEKVFSQLDVNGQVDVEEEGHGLLRRRRMGSVLKEIDED
jgi:predicted RNA-binding protein Jag